LTHQQPIRAGPLVIGPDLNCSEWGEFDLRETAANQHLLAAPFASPKAKALTADLRLRSRSTGLSSQFHFANPPDRRNKTFELDGFCIELIAPCGERFVPLTG
jgi:hypothetical protein